MRINPVNSINYSSYPKQNNLNSKQNFIQNQQHPAFLGKHTSAKLFGAVCGTLGTLGAIGGTIIMTGGVALPFVAGYGALSAATGAILGHVVDKEAEKAEKAEKIFDSDSEIQLNEIA